MRYRGDRDREVSLYAAALLIAIVGACMALLITHAIAAVDFAALAAEPAL